MDHADLDDGAAAPPPAAEERDMLDPREQQKGGFGAFAARNRERHDAEPGPTAQADGAASSVDAVPAPDAVPDATGDTPAAAPPHRRRYFGFLLP